MNSAPVAPSAWRPSVRPRRVCLSLARPALFAAARGSAEIKCRTSEQELVRAVENLGFPAAIFPGDEPARADIDAGIAALEAAPPVPCPLRQPERGGQPAPELLGDWKLIYASSGTYVTRTAAAQALLAASLLPGVGVSDVRQSLQLGSGVAAAAAAGSSSRRSSEGGGGGSSNKGDVPSQQLRTSNVARFGLFVFGDWEVAIQGVWAVQDASLARVSFDGFTLQLTGLLGLIKLPSMAKVSVPVTNSIEADFTTTYLSSSLRVARGRSKNIFLFQRLPS